MEKIHLVFAVLIWLFSVFTLLVVPLPIKVLDGKSYVEDKQSDSNVINHNERVPTYSHINSFLDGPETSPTKLPLGMRLFPKLFKDKIDQQKKPLVDRFFPKPEETTKPPVGGGEGDGKGVGDGGVGGDGKGGDEDSKKPPVGGEDGDVKGVGDGGIGGDGKGGDEDSKKPPVGGEEGDGTFVRVGGVGGDKKGGGKKVEKNKGIGGIIPPRHPTEKTIKIPKFKKDYLGNWVYNPWGVTYGQVWMDTRFKGYGNSNIIYPILFDKYKKVFDINRVSTKKVCNSLTTIYNTPRVMEYLKKAAYFFPHRSWPIFTGLRKQMYREGNSEQCHTRDQMHWRTYVECQMMRNMRLDYMVPRYPLHQISNKWDYDVQYPGWFYDDNPEAWTPEPTKKTSKRPKI